MKAGARAGSVAPVELDRSIQEVIRQGKYSWRSPREKVIQEGTDEQGVIGRFLERVGETLLKWMKKAWEWFENLLRKILPRWRPTPAGSGYGLAATLQVLLYALLAVVLIGAGLLLIRAWRHRFRQPAPIASEPIQPAPDLADENVSADQLPEDGWTKLARELMARGELRLALRAFYLASLAHLAERNLISLAKFKSNRDYERELQRRGHAFPALVTLFGENVLIFDRTWYGMHDLDGSLVDQFAANIERIRTGA